MAGSFNNDMMFATHSSFTFMISNRSHSRYMEFGTSFFQLLITAQRTTLVRQVLYKNTELTIMHHVNKYASNWVCRPVGSNFCGTATAEGTAQGRVMLIWPCYGHCQRYCTEVHSADLTECAKHGKFFHLHFSVVWIGSHSIFVLCTALLTAEYTEGDRA